MVAIGYALCSDEHTPDELIRYVRLAEDAGFAFAFLADHYHPWVGQQVQSPFIWSILGGIAQATHRLPLVVSITCPTVGMHPAVIAQAAATVATMMPGRCCLGLETGEELCARIWGRHWHLPKIRLEMLEEAVQVMRRLWRGGVQSHWGRHYTIENARICTLPKELPAILLAVGGDASAELAGRIGDGLMSITPERCLLHTFEWAGGRGKPRYGKMTVCWVRDESEARRLAQTWWKTALLGTPAYDLALPTHFVRALARVSEADVARMLLCGADASQHVKTIRDYAAVGFDHVYVHHVGPNQEGFIRFYQGEVLPQFQR
jgi:coenzyme F420-dependent glucose-6-phosphate dehydrogenase